MLLAHCTVPFNMAADLGRMFCKEATLLENQYGRDLCRTQVLLQMKNSGVLTGYFLKNPIGNHHIIFSGKHREIIEEFTKLIL